MTARRYFTPVAGLPSQQSLLTDRAVITEAYTFIPRGVLRDIVTSRFPHWHGTRAWVLSRPVAGFATTFSQSIVEARTGRRQRAARAGLARRMRAVRHGR